MAAPVLVHILGNVEQMREIAERTHYMQRLVDGQRIELRGELRVIRLAAPEADRALADGLDAAARGFADLLADDLAEQAPEEPPVLAQQNLLVFPGHGATISEGVASREPASANNN